MTAPEPVQIYLQHPHQASPEVGQLWAETDTFTEDDWQWCDECI